MNLKRWGLTAVLAATPSLAQPPLVPPPVELVRHAVKKEIQANKDPAAYMFRDRKETPQGSNVRLMVETREAMAGLVIAYNDHPLRPKQLVVENDRVQHLMDSPSALRKKRDQEKETEERISRIIKALPEAFLYEHDGTEPGKKDLGMAGEELVRLKFRPNPAYDPPSRVEQVLTGMEGHILIDPKRERIARIEGALQKDVGFGWGILGHLDHGGHILIEQGAAADGYWAITRMDLTFTGRLLLFRRIDVKSSEVYSDFQPAPANLSFAEGIKLLKEQKAKLDASAAHR